MNDSTIQADDLSVIHARKFLPDQHLGLKAAYLKDSITNLTREIQQTLSGRHPT
jgi:hypothetical protein